MVDKHRELLDGHIQIPAKSNDANFAHIGFAKLTEVRQHPIRSRETAFALVMSKDLNRDTNQFGKFSIVIDFRSGYLCQLVCNDKFSVLNGTQKQDIELRPTKDRRAGAGSFD